MQVQQNDAEIQAIASKVSTVKHISIEMRSILGQQLDDIEDLDGSMTSANSMLGRTMNRLSDMIATGGSRNICYLALFMVAIFFVLYSLFQYFRASEA